MAGTTLRVNVPWQPEKSAPGGTYVFDSEQGKFVFVSKETGKSPYDVFVPDGGYWSHNLGPKPIFVESRAHKRRLLKERNWEERSQLSKKEV